MHVYPHPELALIPKLLLPVFEGQRLYVGRKMLTPDQLANVRFCAMLGSDDRANLAMQVSAVVQKICYGRIKKKEWLSACVNVPGHLRLAELTFTDRALVSLQANRYFNHDGPWRSAPVSEIIGPRDHHQIGARLLLAFLLAAESAPSPDAKSAVSALDLTIEVELQRFVQKTIHSPRSSKIYLDAHGWGGRGEITIKKLAQDLSITHERARQIGVMAQNAMNDVEAASEELTVLRNCLRDMRMLSPCLVSHTDEMILEKRYTAGELDTQCTIAAGQRFGLNNELKIILLDGQCFVVNQAESFHLSALRQIARRLLRAHGIIKMDELNQKCEEYFERSKTELDQKQREALKLNAFTVMPGWSFLDSEKEWAIVTLGADGEELRPRGPVARIARLAAYFSGIKLYQAERVLGMHDVRWPSKILLALCLKIGLRVAPLENDWLIEAVGEQLVQLKKSLAATTEFEMAEILRVCGGQLAKPDFIRLCERQNIHRSTVLACLKTASVFLECERGNYCLSNMEPESPESGSVKEGGHVGDGPVGDV